MDEKFVQWEFGLVMVPQQGDLIGSLNKFGDDGWEPWAVLGPGEAPDGTPIVQIGLKRHKRKITLSTDINSALRG